MYAWREREKVISVQKLHGNPYIFVFCLKRLKLELHTVPIKVKTSKEHEMDMGEMMSSD